ncbi:Protein of unknown function [Lactobacillus helveticus CIRM-BIA 951]|jgi:hypothetical protein
MKKE